MKNIHVLPTDKPSRLIINTSGVLTLGKEVYTVLENKQNIYITNDEEIKDGNSIFETDTNTINIVGKHYVKNELDFKIILTTDQDLIKDGVQAIDDEFLEWFVNNPSCEFMETKVEFIQTPDNLKDGFYYKIIIPQEEPKQETLEEVAERFRQTEGNYDIITKIAFEEGAKWQQQQNKNLYSEEEVLNLFKQYQNSFPLHRNVQVLDIEFTEWFEQFKKK